MTKNRKSKKSNKRSFKRTIKRSLKRFKKSFERTVTKLKENVLIHKRLKNKYDIKDVPMDKKENKGTVESSGFVDYHYQRLDNISNFLSKISKNLEYVYIDDNLTIEYDIKTHKIKSLYSTLDYFEDKLKNKKDIKFIVVTFNVQLITFSHANVILIDNDNKNIEFFEPHGHKDDDSTLEGVKGAYFQKAKHLKKFMNKMLPGYTFKNVSEMFKQEGFQMKYDARHGYCVTWSILYIHYRLLNPNTKINIIVEYIYYYITKNKLLRYAKYIEKMLKKI
jgi:hypothetical protein